MRVDQRLRILSFLRQHRLAVLATVTPDGKPEAAAVGFGETDDLELVFGTSVTYRKYRNLQAHQNVSFVIGGDERVTVQYEGVARELREPTLAAYKAAYFGKNPDAQRWEHRPETRYFVVSPTWVRYSDLRQDPPEAFEITF